MRIEIPSAWHEVADLCLKNNLRRILVLGAADRGKSTLCRYLVSRFAQEGARAVSIDAETCGRESSPWSRR